MKRVTGSNNNSQKNRLNPWIHTTNHRNTSKVSLVRTIWLKQLEISLIGKNTVLESLIASQAVYVSMRPCVNQAVIKNIHELFYLFLWSGKNDKIIRDIMMINNFTDGGFKMVDIKSFNKPKRWHVLKKLFIFWKFSIPFVADSKSS